MKKLKILYIPLKVVNDVFKKEYEMSEDINKNASSNKLF